MLGLWCGALGSSLQRRPVHRQRRTFPSPSWQWCGVVWLVDKQTPGWPRPSRPKRCKPVPGTGRLTARPGRLLSGAGTSIRRLELVAFLGPEASNWRIKRPRPPGVTPGAPAGSTTGLKGSRGHPGRPSSSAHARVKSAGYRHRSRLAARKASARTWRFAAVDRVLDNRRRCGIPRRAFVADSHAGLLSVALVCASCASPLYPGELVAQTAPRLAGGARPCRTGRCATASAWSPTVWGATQLMHKIVRHAATSIACQLRLPKPQLSYEPDLAPVYGRASFSGRG